MLRSHHYQNHKRYSLDSYNDGFTNCCTLHVYSSAGLKPADRRRLTLSVIRLTDNILYDADPEAWLEPLISARPRTTSECGRELCLALAHDEGVDLPTLATRMYIVSFDSWEMNRTDTSAARAVRLHVEKLTIWLNSAEHLLRQTSQPWYRWYTWQRC